MARAQTAVEVLIILAASLTVLLILFGLGSSEVTTVQAKQRQEQAKIAANEIVRGANEVYYQGLNARKKIYVVIPEDVNATRTLLTGSEVSYNVSGTDIFAIADVNIIGNLPTEPGGHELVLVAKEGYVSIGDTGLVLNKGSVFVQLVQDGNAGTAIVATNNSPSEQVDVNVSNNFATSGVTLTLSPNTFSLQPSAQQTIDLNFTANATALGTYSGSLLFAGDFNGSTPDPTITVQVTAQVTAADANTSLLSIVPSSWTQSVAKDQNVGKTFTVCNLSDTDDFNVSFSASGDAGDFFVPTTDLNLVADSCANKDLNLSVPSSESTGLKTGTITAADGGNSDTVSLNITVTEGPPIIALFSPVSGYDNTDDGEDLDSDDLEDLEASDNQRYMSDDEWPKNATSYDDALYIEYVFDPQIPSGATILDVNITHEFQRDSSDMNMAARIKVWDANASTWTNYEMQNGHCCGSDVTNVIDISSLINTVYKVNNLKIRFQMFTYENSQKKSKTDLVQLGVQYRE